VTVSRKPLPFSNDLFDEIARTHGTPIYVYDEAGIRANAQRLLKEFAWSPGYRNFFAVKATPTPAILRVVASEGLGFDCSSRGELMMVERAGLPTSGVFFSSNNTPDADYELARRLGATINLDKAAYLDQVQRVLGAPPPSMAIRFNPGDIGVGNAIIGRPRKAKFGDVADRVVDAVRAMREWGVLSVGLHTMVVSNEKDPARFAAMAAALRDLALVVADHTGHHVDFLNIGGGLGVNYHPDEPKVDIGGIASALRDVLEPVEIPIVSEHGRYITGPHGYLLTRVTHGIQRSFEPFLQVDTSINNIARLATVTAAYHQLDVLGRAHDPVEPMNVTGSMCANTDIMFHAYDADGRPKYELPTTTAPGDLLVVHDAGAHCRANSHNYNFRLRCGEVLVRTDGSHQLIRRHETVEDLFRSTDGL
jgi:diaminopimelate decarboxylase